jgi:transcriptional regulator with XRE-family HTH domain
METIGERVRWVRERLHLTQNQFATRLNISALKLSRIENNHGLPDTRMVMHLALEYEINPSWLLMGEDCQAGESRQQLKEMIPIYTSESLCSDVGVRRCEEYLKYPGSNGSCFAWQILDESMLPMIKPQDYLIVDEKKEYRQQDIALLRDVFGYVHARYAYSRHVEKRFYPGNNEYKTIANKNVHRVLGRVVEIVRFYRT